MPLISGKSEEAFRSNLSEMIRAYKTTGKIGNSSPKSLAKARKQALADAFEKRGGK